MTSNHHPIIIIGAGPAGILTATKLKEAGHEALILEKGDNVAHSWYSMPDHLNLVSMWTSNYLQKSDKNLFTQSRQNPAKEFANYVSDLAKKDGLKVEYNSSVKDVSKSGGKIRVQTQAKVRTADIVINATGYWANPQYPPFFDKSNKSLFQMHFKDFKSSRWLKKKIRPGSKVLIVGKRLSAGQLLHELNKDFNLSLSARSSIGFGPGPVMTYIFLRFLNIIEAMTMLFMSNKKKPADVKMEEPHFRILRDNKKMLYPQIEKISGKTITFSDGRSEDFDGVIYTTGFDPATKHIPGEIQLKDDFESRTIPGLFFIGYREQRDYRSRFLRGIRQDVPLLISQLLPRLKQ